MATREIQRPVIVALEPDLFFAVRIADAVRASGAQPLIVEDGDALWPAIERWPELVLIDLAAPGWEAPVRRAKASPDTKAIPIVGFGSHVDTGLLQAARRAGCDHAWARSRFVAELPALLHDTLHPPVRWVEGWDDPPPALLLRGIEQFNEGRYWEAHETLEALWRAEPRPLRDLYQGILQVGIAFHHLRERNYAGAVKVFRRGLPRLRALPETCQGVDVAALRDAARAIYDQVVALGADQIGEYDLDGLPEVRLVR